MSENGKEIEKILGIELAGVLREFCEWSGKRAEEFITEAVSERLKGDLEEIASYDVPKAKEFAERLKGLS